MSNAGNKLQIYGRHRDSANAADIETVADNIADVNSVAGDIDDVTAVAAAMPTIVANEGAINGVAANATNINTVAAAEAEIDTVAQNIADVNAVVADEADIGVVATNIANVNTVAAANTAINAVNSNLSNINAVNANEADIDTVAANLADIQTVAAADADIDIVVANVAAIQTAALLVEYNDNELDFPSRDFRLDVSESVRAVQSIVNGQVVSNVSLLDKLHFGDGLMPVAANLSANITLTVQMSSAEIGKNVNLRTNFYDESNTLVRQVDHGDIVVPDDTSETTIALNNSLLNTDVSTATVGRVEIKRQAATANEHGGDLQVKRAVVAYV